MKIFLALFIVLFSISFAQSRFVPDWNNCGGGVGWKTNNVTLDDAPVAGENATFHICGTNKDFYVLLFEKIHVSSGTLLDLTFNNDTGVNWRQSVCFDLTFQLPQEAPAEMYVKFDMKGDSPVNIGCANVTLKFDNDTFEPLEFLSRRIRRII